MHQQISLPDRQRRASSGLIWSIGTMIVAAGFAGMLAATVVTGAAWSPLTWYLARASGFSLYLLLWLSVVSGLGMTTKVLGWFGRNGENWHVHRLATEVGFVALVVHMLALALDSTVPLGVVGVLVPFTSQVRQPWTDLGIVTAWGMLGVTLSYGMQRWIGRRGWRALHYLTFPLWFGGLVHGVGSGSDSGSLWGMALYLATTAVVLFLLFYRLLRAGQRGRHPVTHPAAIRDREVMLRRVAAYRERCASLSSKTNVNSPS